MVAPQVEVADVPVLVPVATQAVAVVSFLVLLEGVPLPARVVAGATQAAEVAVEAVAVEAAAAADRKELERWVLLYNGI